VGAYVGVLGDVVAQNAIDARWLRKDKIERM
jgi:hypothetical protein